MSTHLHLLSVSDRALSLFPWHSDEFSSTGAGVSAEESRFISLIDTVAGTDYPLVIALLDSAAHDVPCDILSLF